MKWFKSTKAYKSFKKADDKEVAKKSTIGYRGRQIIVLVCVLGFSLFVGYHLLKYTVLESEKWRALANRQQSGVQTIMANRGSIYDTNGTVLAQSSTVWNIIVAPAAIEKAEPEYRAAYDKAYKRWLNNSDPDKGTFPEYIPLKQLIITNLSEILGVEEDFIAENCDMVDKMYRVIKRNVEKPEVVMINAFMKEHEIPGDCVYAEQSSKRYYPNGTLASNVIGFIDHFGDGVYGLEAYYDDYLKGTDGKIFYTIDGKGQGVEYGSDNYFPAVDGYSLVLTLDEVMQHYVEKNLEQCVSQHSVINRACGIIVNCNTGAVLAMATTPGYDLNNPSTIMGAYEQQLYEQFKLSGASEQEIVEYEKTAREQQWKNKAITELYYPGSVFKTVTSAAALEEEVISTSDSFSCPGFYDVAGTIIHCWTTGGHGTLSLQDALIKSCNPSFIQIGMRLGIDKFSQYFRAFGFTEPTGIDLPGEAQSIYRPIDKMSLVDLASSSIGQTNKITPMQMCMAICAVVNGGYLVTPHLVDKILDGNGNVVETRQTEIKRQVISEETSARMRDLLENVVEVNGGHNAAILGYRIGGKSGTAEKIDEFNAAGGEAAGAKMTYISTFAATVPADNPQIVMLVIADTPTGTQYYGSSVAAPVVSAVFKEGLEHLGIYPTYTAEEQAKLDATVPYVIGYLSMRAEGYLTAAGFEVRFVGDPNGSETVTTQIPPSGSSIPKGSTVVLYLGNSHELETATVPNVIGMSVAKANEVITNAGFNIKIEGGAAENAEAVATMQSLPEGYTAYKGTAITVTFQVNTFAD